MSQALDELRLLQTRLSLGDELYHKVRQTRVLVVGAGGIGSELLKDLVLSGFDNITIVDLDTIDISNLNRQFLFRKEHVGLSKAEIAKQSILKFNPNLKNIHAYQRNIMDKDLFTPFTLQQNYDLVFSALDNDAARNYLNVLCYSAGLPLFESGTTGYLGQVYAVVHGLSQCKQCRPTQQPKQFPVCTIRNTPEKPEHCIVWGKNIFALLFDMQENEDFALEPRLLDLLYNAATTDVSAVLNSTTTETTTTSATDKENKTNEEKEEDKRSVMSPEDYAILQRTSTQIRQIYQTLDIKLVNPNTPDFTRVFTANPAEQNDRDLLQRFFLAKAIEAFCYYYIVEVADQRCFHQRWAKRKAPTILDLPELQALNEFAPYSFGEEKNNNNNKTTSASAAIPKLTIYEMLDHNQQKSFDVCDMAVQFIVILKDLFIRQYVGRYEKIQKQQQQQEQQQNTTANTESSPQCDVNIDDVVWSFDKDDQLCMSFVSASSNLRMAVHHIQTNSYFANKGIAGNIIHAIATTNAISAGALVAQSLTWMKHQLNPNYLPYSPAVCTSQEGNKCRVDADAGVYAAWISSRVMSDPALPPPIECFCSHPQILTFFKNAQSYHNIKWKTLMLLIEAFMMGLFFVQHGAEHEATIQKILNLPNNNSYVDEPKKYLIEDFQYELLTSVPIKTLGSRDELFFFKVYPELEMQQQVLKQPVNKAADSDDDDDMSDDDDDERNELLDEALSSVDIEYGSVLRLVQAHPGTRCVVRLYHNDVTDDVRDVVMKAHGLNDVQRMAEYKQLSDNTQQHLDFIVKQSTHLREVIQSYNVTQRGDAYHVEVDVLGDNSNSNNDKNKNENNIEKINFYFNTTHLLQHAKRSIASVQDKFRQQEEAHRKEKEEKAKQRKVRFQQTNDATDGQAVDIDDQNNNKMTNIDIDIDAAAEDKIQKDIKKQKVEQNETTTTAATTAIAQIADGNELVQLPPPQPVQPQHDCVELD